MTKNNIKAMVAGVMVLAAAGACEKNKNTSYREGVTPVLSSSVTSISATVADSNATAAIFSWTNPNYPTPLPGGSALYTLQFDSAGHNFAAYQSISVNGNLSDSVSAKVINSMVLAMGGQFNTPYSLEVRVVSSYGNTNDALNSNVVTINVTPYKTPPKVTPPLSLYLVGSATACTNDLMVDTSIQKFFQVDSVDFADTVFLAASGGYYFVPVNGSNATRYNLTDSTAGATSQGGVFQVSSNGSGNMIPAPALSGLYAIKISFQTGYYTVTPVRTWSNWWVPGNYQGWAPATAPTLAATANDGNYQGYVNLTDMSGFKFTPAPNWNSSYGDGGSGYSGTLSTSGGNIAIPAVGYWFLQADSAALTYSGLQITEWGLIGDFNGWGGDIAMTYNSSTQEWTGSYSFGSSGFFKIRANQNWNAGTPNYGLGGPGGSMVNNGGNIPFPAGTHTVTFRLNNPGYYTITVQ
jgi:starch-binding outer membrane protein SusE/F